MGRSRGGVKALFDGYSDVRGQLENKVGGAFTSSASIEGGNQTTLMSILQVMLIHAIIVVGDPMESGDHYGAIAIGEPSTDALEICRQLGARVGKLTKMLAT